MRAGKLRHVVQIQVRSDTPTSSGQRAFSWSTFATVRASVEPLAGREFYAAQAQERGDRVNTRFRLRYLAGLKPRMRIVWDGRWFDITSIIQMRGLRHELVVMAQELVEVPLS